MPEMLCAEKMAAHLQSKMQVYVVEEVDSTNTWARRLLSEGKTEAALLAAEYQTAGRGRQGKSFYSPRGTGLYMTLLLPWNQSVDSPVQITVEASVAVCRALETLTGQPFQIKWVNDIYQHGKKVCGILAEAVTDWEQGVIRHLILGVGVNVRKTDVPEELQDIVGWLDCPVDRNILAAEIANQMANPGCAAAYYKAHSLVLGQNIRYLENGQWKDARAVDIDDEGGLVIRLESGEMHTLKSGEISVRLHKTEPA